jgi:hypothetical protein
MSAWAGEPVVPAASVAAVTALDVSPPTAPAGWSPADLRMRRVLRLPTDAPKASEVSARQLVEKSLLISMVRCLLTYIVLPFAAPIFGFATGVAPVVGLVVGLVAIAANIASVRRFWRADHRYRWHYTALASVIVAALVWLVIADLVELLT